MFWFYFWPFQPAFPAHPIPIAVAIPDARPTPSALRIVTRKSGPGDAMAMNVTDKIMR